MRYFHAYEAYCSAPIGDDEWPAQRIGTAAGPFELGWKLFMQSQRTLARAAEERYLVHERGMFNTPCLWKTREVFEAMEKVQRDAFEAMDIDDDDYEDAGLIVVVILVVVVVVVAVVVVVL